MRVIHVGIVAAAVAGAAWAQNISKVDQGRPGNQGPWPVTVQGGGFSADGGSIFVITGKCRALVQTNDAGIGTTPSVIPVNGGTAGRVGETRATARGLRMERGMVRRMKQMAAFESRFIL